MKLVLVLLGARLCLRERLREGPSVGGGGGGGGARGCAARLFRGGHRSGRGLLGEARRLLARLLRLLRRAPNLLVEAIDLGTRLREGSAKGLHLLDVRRATTARRRGSKHRAARTRGGEARAGRIIVVAPRHLGDRLGDSSPRLLTHSPEPVVELVQTLVELLGELARALLDLLGHVGEVEVGEHVRERACSSPDTRKSLWATSNRARSLGSATARGRQSGSTRADDDRSNRAIGRRDLARRDSRPGESEVRGRDEKYLRAQRSARALVSASRRYRGSPSSFSRP